LVEKNNFTQNEINVDNSKANLKYLLASMANLFASVLYSEIVKKLKSAEVTYFICRSINIDRTKKG